MRWHCMVYEKLNVILPNKIQNIIVLSVLQAWVPPMCQIYLKQIFKHYHNQSTSFDH